MFQYRLVENNDIIRLDYIALLDYQDGEGIIVFLNNESTETVYPGSQFAHLIKICTQWSLFTHTQVVYFESIHACVYAIVSSTWLVCVFEVEHVIMHYEWYEINERPLF